MTRTLLVAVVCYALLLVMACSGSSGDSSPERYCGPLDAEAIVELSPGGPILRVPCSRLFLAPQEPSNVLTLRFQSKAGVLCGISSCVEGLPASFQVTATVAIAAENRTRPVDTPHASYGLLYGIDHARNRAFVHLPSLDQYKQQSVCPRLAIEMLLGHATGLAASPSCLFKVLVEDNVLVAFRLSASELRSADAIGSLVALEVRSFMQHSR